MEENRRLRARVEELERIVRALQEQVQVLTAALEEARRAGKRQAAPFRGAPPHFLDHETAGSWCRLSGPRDLSRVSRGR